MAFSKARRLSDFIAADGTVPATKFATGTITSAMIADTSITPTDLHTSLDLTGKTVTVATASGTTNTTAAASTAFVQQELTTLIGGAPSTLNDLNELAAAINDDANYNSTLTTALATKLPLAGGTMTGALDVGGTITGDDGLSIQGGAGNAYLQVGSNTGSWTWKNYQSTHKLALEDSDGTGEVLNFSTSGAATFSSTIAATGQITSARGSDTGTYGFRHEGAGKYMRMGVANASFAYFETDANGGFSFEGEVTVPNKISHAGDTDTYMQFHQADGWRVVTAGSERFHIEGNQVVVNHDGHDQDFRVESDGNANMLFVDGGNNSVGIGTASPSASLHISKDGGNAEVEALRLSNGDSGFTNNEATHAVALTFDLPSSEAGTASNRLAAKIVAGKGEAGANDWFTSGSSTNFNGRLDFYTRENNVLTKQMTLDEDGNVGIGTATPTTAPSGAFTWASPATTIAGSRPVLYLNGSSSYTTLRMWPSGTDGASTTVDDWHVNTVAGGTSAGRLSFSPQGGAVSGRGLSLKPDGKVGIGTWTPGAKLEIKDGDLWLNGATSGSNPEISFIDDAGPGGIAGAKIRYGNSDGNLYFEHKWDTATSGFFFRNRVDGTTLNTMSLVNGTVTMPYQPYGKASCSSPVTAGNFAPLNAYVVVRGGIVAGTNRFTVPVSGAYMVAYQHLGETASTQGVIYKNGVKVNGTSTQDTASGSNGGLSSQSIIILAANDYIQYKCRNGKFHQNADYNSMTIHLLG
jgi:hypothetical protein